MYKIKLRSLSDVKENENRAFAAALAGVFAVVSLMIIFDMYISWELPSPGQIRVMLLSIVVFLAVFLKIEKDV